MMISIDNAQYDLYCDIERIAEVRPSEISGALLNKNYFNDIIGTYMQYTVTLVVPPSQRATVYEQLYNVLTQPVGSHTFVLPYGQTTTTITGRVDSVRDTYTRLSGDSAYWRGLSFTVTANSPSKTNTLGQVVNRGTGTMPSVAEHSEGDTWVWTNGHWALAASWRDADSIAY